MEKIERYVKNPSFDEFLSDEKTVDAIVRNFEIIVEAARPNGLSKPELIRVLEHLQNNRGFVLENFQVFNDALALFQNSNLSFSDSVILAFSRRERCDLLTFDKKLLKLDGAKQVK